MAVSTLRRFMVRMASRRGTLASAVASAACLMLPASVAHAADDPPRQTDLGALPIEKLLDLEVSTASRFAQRQSEAPSSVTIVTAAEIKAYGWRTLADLLRSVRGLHVEYDRNYARLGARGFLRPGDYNGRFLLMVDGSRLNDSVYDNAAIGTEFPLDLDMIERVEFVPGPGSSVYGTNAVFGVINVISRRGRDLSGGQGAIAAGSHNAGEARASYGWRGNDGRELLFSASSFSTRGADLYYPEFDKGTPGSGWARHLDYDRGERIFLRASHGIAEFTLLQSARTKGVPTASFEQRFNDARSHTIDTTTLAALQLRHMADAGLEWTSRFDLARISYEGSYPYPLDVVNDGSLSRQWHVETKLVSTAWRGHKLVAGLELHRDVRRDQYYTKDRLVAPLGTPIFGGAAPTFHFYDHRSDLRSALYVQDEISLTPELLLNAGLRYDDSQNASSNLSPRVALVWQARPGTTLKAIHGNAFRSPNAYELYYMLAGLGGQVASPHLKSERIHSTELALEQEVGANARFSMTLFRNDVADLIDQVETASGLLQFKNNAHVNARGVELEYQRAWDDGSRLRISWSAQRAVNEADGVRLVKSPARMANLNLSTPLLAGAAHAGVELQYLSARRSLAGEAPPYWIANLQLSTARLARGVDVSLGFYNLFGRRYADPASTEHVQDLIAQDGRSLRLKIVAAF